MFGGDFAGLQGYGLAHTFAAARPLHPHPVSYSAAFRTAWLDGRSMLPCLLDHQIWCVGAQPFLIGAFSNFTTPMIILGAMDLAAAVMLLCAHPLQRQYVCPSAKVVVDSVCQYLRIGVGVLLAWIQGCSCNMCPPVHDFALHQPPKAVTDLAGAFAASWMPGPASCLVACMRRLQVSGPDGARHGRGARGCGGHACSWQCA